MSAARWIAHISAARVIAVLIRENTFKNQELFSLRVTVRWKKTARCISDDTRRPGYFITNSVEHAPVNA